MILEKIFSQPEQFFFPLMGSVFLGFMGLFFVLKIFPKMGLLDFPERYGLTRKKIPYPAGIAVFFVFILSLVFWYHHLKDPKILGFLGALGILVTVAFADDRKNISAIFRLIVQAVVAAIIIFSGSWIEFMRNPFSPEAFHLPFWLGGLITFFWIIGFINVSNWLDGVPNVTLGSGLVASITLGFLSLKVDQSQTAMLCFLLAASIFPFVLGNIGRTKFLLGDTGSMMIGCSIAALSLLSGGKMATALIVMAIPIFDGLYVFGERISEKKSPFAGGDKRHLHDKLLQKGWSGSKIFWVYTSVAALLGVSVLLLTSFQKFCVIVAFAVIFFVVRWRMK